MSISKLKEMIPYGKWLTEYLSTELKPHRCKDLFKWGAEILNTHEDLSGECTLLRGFEKLEVFDGKPLHGCKDAEEMNSHITKFLELRHNIKEELKDLTDSYLPWEKALYHGGTGLMHHLEFRYSCLYETVRADTGTYKKVNSFTMAEEYTEGKKTKTTVELNLVYSVIVARIFFNYFFAGGQEYFGFCSYCGDFFSTQRKIKKSDPRKRFCCDVCRASYWQEKDKIKKMKVIEKTGKSIFTRREPMSIDSFKNK